MASEYLLALAHYRLTFPDIASMGAGDPPSKWKAEYDGVAGRSLGQTLITSTSMEGGAASAIRNFDQTVLLRALHARRRELDSNYDAFALPTPANKHQSVTVKL